jgi:hypothetical protein
MSATAAANFEAVESRNDFANPPLVSRNAIREKLRDALRLHVGRGRRYTVKELSNGTGVADRLIESAMCDVESPDYRPLSLEALASISKFLGVSFASAYLELSGLGAFELMDGQIPLPKVLSCSTAQEDAAEERKRLIRRLAELEGVQ